MDNKRIGENMYNLVSKFKPAGDQPKAIKELTEGMIEGKKFQTLLRSNRNRQNIYNSKCYKKCR